MRSGNRIRNATVAASVVASVVLPSGAATAAGTPVPTAIGSPVTRSVTDANAQLVAVADVTGDGRPDLLLATDAGATASTALKLYLFVRGASLASVPVKYGLHATSGPFAIATGDLDDDGRTDVAVASDQGVDVLLGWGNGLAAAVLYPAPQIVFDVETGDVNDDGLTDLVYVVATPGFLMPYTIVRRLQLAGGGFGTPAEIDTVSGTDVKVGDVNNDGRDDILPIEGTATMRLLLQLPDHSFSLSTEDQPATSMGPAAIADVNGDGRNDVLVTQYQPSGVNVFPGAANELPGAPTFIPTPNESTGLATGDVNADGTTDVVATGGYNTTTFMLQDPSGALIPSCPFLIGWGIPVLGDLVGSNRPDLTIASGQGVGERDRTDMAVGGPRGPDGDAAVLPRLLRRGPARPGGVRLGEPGPSAGRVSANRPRRDLAHLERRAGRARRHRGTHFGERWLLELPLHRPDARRGHGDAPGALPRRHALRPRELGRVGRHGRQDPECAQAGCEPLQVRDRRLVPSDSQARGWIDEQDRRLLPVGGGSKVEIGQVLADANGVATLNVSPKEYTRYAASYAGDESFAASDSADVTVSVVARVDGKMVRFAATSGRYRIYRPSQRVFYWTKVTPLRPGAKVTVALQYYAKGRWRAAAAQNFRLRDDSTALVYVPGQQLAQQMPFRFFTMWRGDAKNRGARSGYAYFKVLAGTKAPSSSHPGAIRLRR